MIRVNEFLYLYCLKPSTHYGYYELLLWDRKFRFVNNLPSYFYDWKLRYFFISGTSWETILDEVWGEVPKLLRKWEIPSLGACLSCSRPIIIIIFSFNCFWFTFLKLQFVQNWTFLEGSKTLTSLLTRSLCTTNFLVLSHPLMSFGYLLLLI